MSKIRKKLTDKKKKLIVADYIDCGNYSEVARKHGVSDTTVRKLVNTDSKSLKKIEQKKEENTKDVLEYMDSLNEKKKSIINKLLLAIEDKADKLDSFTNIKDVASAYGIIIDKEIKLREIKTHEKNNEDGVVIVDDLPKDCSKTE
jgi:transposase-like protein|nr:MAG TPA: ECF sigma factor [Caudoviricetes sp.]